MFTFSITIKYLYLPAFSNKAALHVCCKMKKCRSGRKVSERTPLCSISEESAILDDILPVSLCRQIGYSIGGIGHSMLTSFAGVYFTAFLLEVAKMEPIYVSVVMLFGNGVKAFSDPLVGYLISQSPHTRIGKFSPWMIISLPFYSVLYCFIWFVPQESTVFKIWYYILIYCLVNISNACFIIPYVSSVLAVTSCQQQRDLLVAGRLICNVFGSIFAMVIFAVLNFLGKFYRWDIRSAYLITGIIGGALMLILGFIVFMSIDERFVLDHGRGKWGPIFKPYLNVLKFKPYRILLCSILFSYLAYQTTLSIFPLYFKYVLEAENMFPFCTVIVTLCSALSMFFWKFLTVKIGKKTTLIIGTVINMIILWSQLYMKYNFILLIVVCVFFGFATACCVNLVPSCMIPDAIAAYSLEHGHGEEAMFYSITFFIETVSWAVCSSLSTLALQAAGYQSANDIQPPGVALALRLIIGVFSVICSLIALISVMEYPITEKARKGMQSVIKESMNCLYNKA